MDYKAVLTDTKGTTTSISFVYDTLFPYARKHLESICEKNSRQVKNALEMLQEEFSKDNSTSEFGNGATYLQYLMDQDVKSTALKKIQGVIWEDGYLSGELKGHVYDDVAQVLKIWKERNIRVRVFSSGSLLAQKLLFGYSNHGNLCEYFEGYHDTTTGSKKEQISYQLIANEFGLDPKEILFISDMLYELDPAAKVGMQTGLFIRPGNKSVDMEKNTHKIYNSFHELLG